jgi:hypothetical protein
MFSRTAILLLISSSTLYFDHQSGARPNYRRLQLVVPKVWRKSGGDGWNGMWQSALATETRVRQGTQIDRYWHEWAVTHLRFPV